MTVIQQKRNIRKHAAGDMFQVALDSGEFLVGMIALDLRGSKGGMGFVLYLYENRFTEVPKDVSTLELGELLLPPFFEWATPWTQGWCRTFGHRDPTEHLLPQHCFLRRAQERYVDELDRPLPRRYEPCGEYGASLYPAREIEKALVGQLAPVRQAEPDSDFAKELNAILNPYRNR